MSRFDPTVDSRATECAAEDCGCFVATNPNTARATAVYPLEQDGEHPRVVALEALTTPVPVACSLACLEATGYVPADDGAEVL